LAVGEQRKLQATKSVSGKVVHFKESSIGLHVPEVLKLKSGGGLNGGEEKVH